MTQTDIYNLKCKKTWSFFIFNLTSSFLIILNFFIKFYTLKQGQTVHKLQIATFWTGPITIVNNHLQLKNDSHTFWKVKNK